jgi:hypothetical protein
MRQPRVTASGIVWAGWSSWDPHGGSNLWNAGVDVKRPGYSSGRVSALSPRLSPWIA